MPIRTLRAVAGALDVRVDGRAARVGRGARPAPRRGSLGDARGAGAAVRRRCRTGSSLPEVTFSIYGERGAIDVLAWHEPTRSLLVIELKTELVDMQETVGTLDRKVRLAMKIARERGWDPLTVSTLAADRRVAVQPAGGRRHAAMLGQRFPADGHAMTRWLRQPAGGSHALSFLSSDAPGRALDDGSRRSARVRPAAAPHGPRWPGSHSLTAGGMRYSAVRVDSSSRGRGIDQRRPKRPSAVTRPRGCTGARCHTPVRWPARAPARTTACTIERTFCAQPRPAVDDRLARC